MLALTLLLVLCILAAPPAVARNGGCGYRIGVLLDAPRRRDDDLIQSLLERDRPDLILAAGPLARAALEGSGLPTLELLQLAGAPADPAIRALPAADPVRALTELRTLDHWRETGLIDALADRRLGDERTDRREALAATGRFNRGTAERPGLEAARAARGHLRLVTEACDRGVVTVIDVLDAQTTAPAAEPNTFAAGT